MKKDIELVNKIQDSILKSYESDFSKHVSNVEANKISFNMEFTTFSIIKGK